MRLSHVCDISTELSQYESNTDTFYKKCSINYVKIVNFNDTSAVHFIY